MARRDQLLLGATSAALVAAILSIWLLLAPTIAGEPGADAVPDVSFVASGSPSPAVTADVATLLVDVEGGVEHPGIVELPAEARLGEAIAAAGGYSKDADVVAAAVSLNLAAALTDGQQVYVPLVGVAGPPGGSTGGGAAGAGGSGGGADGALVSLNSATPEALDALPGIGPVTVQKIVAARQEQPFATLEELVERKVMNNGQLEKIRDLVTL